MTPEHIALVLALGLAAIQVVVWAWAIRRLADSPTHEEVRRLIEQAMAEAVADAVEQWRRRTPVRR